MNICSVIVNAKPENAPGISKLLAEIEGVDVFGGIEEGKIIATIEDGGGEKALADKMAAMNDIKGVINATMIYHQEEDNTAMEEEIV